MVPERPTNFRKVCFVEKRAVARRLQVDAANLHVQRVFLGSDEYVGANGAQLAVNLVTNVGGDRDHCRGHSHAQRDGHRSQQFPPLLAAKRFVNEPGKHRYCFSNTRLPAAMSAS